MGFNNVAGFEGRFEVEHIEKLKDNRVKEVVLAVKNEVASITASEVFKELLNSEGIAVRVLHCSFGCNNWNEALRKGVVKEEVEGLIELALVSKVEETKNFKVTKDNLSYTFIINDIKYRVIGVKDLFVNNLKVNISADFGQEWFPDSVDLYSSRIKGRILRQALAEVQH